MVCILGVAACRTTVPEPTMQIKDSDKSFPKYSMHNVGPQHVQNSFSIRFSDLNQDGSADLIIGLRKPEAGYRIEWGDGQGHWRTQQGPGTSLETRSAAVADVEHDGTLDVLIGGEGDQQGMQVWHYDYVDGWVLHSSPTESGQFRDVALADINEDGWVDVLGVQVNSEESGGIYAWLNDGRGGWAPNFGPLANGIFTGLVVTDVNGDGHLDIVAARRGGVGARQADSNWKGKGSWVEVGGVQVWYGDGAARWEPQNLPADGDVVAMDTWISSRLSICEESSCGWAARVVGSKTRSRIKALGLLFAWAIWMVITSAKWWQHQKTVAALGFGHGPEASA